MRTTSPTRVRQTVTLTERTPAECPLAPADVRHLLEHHRAHLTVEATARTGLYRLTPTGHVGTVVGPSVRLVIRPKIPVESFLRLLDAEAPVPPFADSASAPAGELFDLLAGYFVRLLTERADAGLYRGYEERSGSGCVLRGRLDAPAQCSEPHARRDRLHYCYDDFTTDVAWNRLPRAVAERLLRWPLLGASLAGPLRAALGAFSEVSGSDDEAGPGPPSATPAPAGYARLLQASRILAEGLAPGGRDDRSQYPAFLLNLERLFEGYVARGVESAFTGRPGFAVRIQPSLSANRPAAGQPDIVLRPDVVVEREGRPVLVVDAKWKDLAGSPLVTADVYQVLAYATGLGAARGVLVYPGARDRRWRYRLARAAVRLEVHEVAVTGDRASCSRSLERLARALRKRSGGA